MESTKQETKTSLTREDLVNILGGCNVACPADSSESSGTNRIRQTQQQQESLACDAIG